MSPGSSQEPDPPQGESFAARLKKKYGEGVDPAVSLHAADEAGEKQADFSSVLVARLSSRSESFGRYRLKGEIARGGMGAILKIWDEDLHRHLAMKVILGQVESPPPARTTNAPAKSDTPPTSTPKLARFLEEAQVTAQLDHPGIVPVHELGLDPEGRVYFTMKLVKGQSLKEVFDLAAEDKEGWSQTKVLGLLLKVCEAMAYAHDKGVIHRDLKPANIMVGKFGEVHVMDWGLARILGREDEKDVRIRAEGQSHSTELRSERDAHRGETPDSPLYTMDGDVVGTPAYMSPEQAAGKLDEVGPHSDVYAMGAMLYHLLAGHMPYVPKEALLNNYAVWGLVQQGPPRSIAQLSPETPAELIAICEKAMAREWKSRFGDMSELAADLSAYLEHRVVGAYQTGAWAETKKWVERNRALAAALAAAVLLLVAGLSASLVFKARADDKEKIATQRANDVLSLSAIQDLKELENRADALWPADPKNVPKYEAWLADARVLIEGQPADPARGIKKRPSLAEHEAKLLEIRARAKPSSREQADGDAGEGAHYEFEDNEDRWWHAQLTKLVLDLKAFEDEKGGGLFSSGTSEKHGQGIAKRVEIARSIRERSVDGPEARRRWAEAVAGVASSPKYGGLRLEPQLGLLPIGADPKSGLWEFAHLESGEPAQRGADGKLVLADAMGLVLVLVPGGTFDMGAQREDPHQPGFDPDAASNEGPVGRITLAPFFLSKYETTQAQWLRFTATNPSDHHPETNATETPDGLRRPVEQVSWNDCATFLARLDLAFPTEAQWEFAARAGTTTVWPTGDAKESIAGSANLADSYCKAHGGPGAWVYDDWLDDGCAITAPVGTYLPNAFGFHDMIGNVWEWCRDAFGGYEKPVRPNDGERIAPGSRYRAVRGGSFADVTLNARTALRTGFGLPDRDAGLGLRPARAVSP